MSENPLVSVLVPVYKTEEFLAECLESLIHQTLEEIEIVCVNDGSPDRCAKILKEYQKKDPRIVVVTKKNGGLPSARNAGLDKARGKYVGFVDSDDFVDVNMFKRLYETAEKHQSEIVVCGAEIFPVPPEPDGWLYATLSPENRHYPNFQSEILFELPYARPFVWRTMIKRELIERNQLRLQEDIHIGEDNAFQFRLYPKANGITFVSDKLYHYRWYREGSLMSSSVYANSPKRVESHIKLICHIAEQWQKTGEMKEMGRQFLQWSVEFLYDDFIRLPLPDKVQLAGKLVPVWGDCGYYRYKNILPDYIRDMFTYFFDVSKEQAVSPKISVILPVCDSNHFISQTLRNITEQTLKEIEIICINNAAGSATYSILHKYLHADKRVRIYNQAKTSYAQVLNVGLTLAAGEYLTFMEPNDWYSSTMALERWNEFACDHKSDVCGTQFETRDSMYYKPIQLALMREADEEDYYLESDFHNILYRTALIRKYKIQFEDYSIETGRVFAILNYLHAKRKTFFYEMAYCHRNNYEKDWISTDECGAVLRCFLKMIQISVEQRNAQLHIKTLSLLNSDYMINLLINNTRPYWMSPQSCPNGENSQIEIWDLLLQITAAIDPELTKSAENGDGFYCLPDIMSIFVDVRHKYLAEISNRLS